jgi:2TM family of unknown function (DUF5676)
VKPGNEEDSMATITQARREDALNIRTLGLSLTVFFVFSYLVCVLGGVLFPGMIVHRMLDLLLPGFEWLSWRSFLIGLVGSVGWAWYIALVFVPIYNFVHARR